MNVAASVLMPAALVMLCVACKSASMSGNSAASPASTPPATSSTATPVAPLPASPYPPLPTTLATSQTATAPASSPSGNPNPQSATPLTGLWDATGYTCDGGAPAIEEISVTQSGSDFVGTKVTGDNCVPAGYISFRGTLASNGALSLQFNQAAPGGPVNYSSYFVSGTYTPTLIQISADSSNNPPLQLQPHRS